MRRKQGVRVVAGFFSTGTLQAMEEMGDNSSRGDEGKRVFLSDGVMKHKSLMKNGCRRRQGGFGWCFSLSSPSLSRLLLPCLLLTWEAVPPLKGLALFISERGNAPGAHALTYRVIG